VGTWQVLLDLSIMCFITLGFITRDARRTGRTVWPFAVLTIAVAMGAGLATFTGADTSTTLKLLGATSRTIFLSYLLQIGLVAAGAIVAGLLVGALVPWIVTLIAGSALPVPPRLALYPLPLLFSAAYGLLIALAFAILPLARARTVPAASLFRGTLEPLRRPPLVPLAAALIAASSIAALAILTAREPAFDSSAWRWRWCCC